MSNPKQLVKIARWYQVRQSGIMILFLCLFLGFIYPALADGFSSIYPFINGVLIGIIGGSIIFLFEFYIFHDSLKKIRFSLLVLMKVITYSVVFTILVITIILISRGIQYDYHSLHDMYYSPEFRHFLFKEDLQVILTYTFLFTLFIIFTKEISNKLGRDVLTNFITGKYYKPQREERIFMFLDLKDSTTIAEQLNGLEFHTFVNTFFKDISDSISFTKGEIYKYIGDEIVVSWSMKSGVRNANCVYTYLYALQSIEKEKDKYLNKFGFVPEFKASLHCGNVIRGEVGDVKSEIAFSGDVMNTTARIEGLCSKLDEPLLISGELFKNFSINVKQNFVFKGSFELKGKLNSVKVYSLKDKTKDYLELDRKVV